MSGVELVGGGGKEAPRSRGGIAHSRPGWGCCDPALVGEPDHAFDVVDEVGKADFGCRAGEADGPDKQPHWAFLTSEDMLDRGTSAASEPIKIGAKAPTNSAANARMIADEVAHC